MAQSLRHVIPWDDMERKFADKIAAQSGEHASDGLAPPVQFSSAGQDPPQNEPSPKNSVAPPPASGVRSSADAPSGLTYSVYTFADLEASGQARPPRTSIAAAPPVPPSPSRWTPVWNKGGALVRAGWQWARLPKPRPSVSDACRLPLEAFVDALVDVLRALPWRKYATWAGFVVGTLAVLLFAVLIVAELTDDLKPARSGVSLARRSAVTPTPTSLGAEMRNRDVPRTVAPAPAEAIEAPAASFAFTPAPPSKAAPKKLAPKKKAVELFIP